MNRMKKLIKLSTIVFIIIAIIMIISIIIALFNPTPTEDDNVPRPSLDDFKIEELTEEQITKIPFCSNGFVNSSHTCGKRSGIGESEYKYDDVDFDHCRYSSKKKVGISTFNATHAENTILTIDIKSSIGGGKARIVIIRDGAIIESFECGESKTFVYQVEGESIFYVKGLFENAENFEIDVVRAFDGEKTNVDH